MFRVAETLGMTVTELSERMTASELAEWAAYEAWAGPLGGARYDMLAARISYTLWQIAMAKSGKRFTEKFEKFLLFGKTKKRAQSQKEMAAILGAFAAAHNAMNRKR